MTCLSQAASIVALTLALNPIGVTAQTRSDLRAAPDKSNEQRLSEALRDVINKGVDLYNPPVRDHGGCFRLYQGALMAVRVQLHVYPDLRREVDAALADAERVGPDGQRAYMLRRALDQIRTTIGQKNPSGKPPEVKTTPSLDEKKVEPMEPMTRESTRHESSMKITVNGKPVSGAEEAALRGFAAELVSRGFASAVNRAWRELQWIPFH